jgi:prepilin-type N-terminal cleavage/methylation domain-containing protein
VRPLTVHRRTGVTLVELLVALALAGAVAATALTVLRSQLRQTAAMMSHRVAESSVDDALSLLRADVRAALPVADVDHGFVSVIDSMVDLWALRGIAVVCDTQPSNRVVVVAPSAGEPRAASWPAAPRTGDRITYPEAPDIDVPAADRWRSADIVAIDGPTSCPPIAGRPRAAGLRWQLSTVRPPLGAVLRVARRTQHRLYRSSDGAWSIGAREWDGLRWSTTQPIVAPLARAGVAGGVVLRPLDDAGRVMNWPPFPGTTVSAVRATVRGTSWPGVPLDSFTMTLAAGRP